MSDFDPLLNGEPLLSGAETPVKINILRLHSTFNSSPAVSDAVFDYAVCHRDHSNKVNVSDFSQTETSFKMSRLIFSSFIIRASTDRETNTGGNIKTPCPRGQE